MSQPFVTNPTEQTPCHKPFGTNPLSQTPWHKPFGTKPLSHVQPLVTNPLSQPLGTNPSAQTPFTNPLSQTPCHKPLVTNPLAQTLWHKPLSQPLVTTPCHKPLVTTPCHNYKINLCHKPSEGLARRVRWVHVGGGSERLILTSVSNSLWVINYSTQLFKTSLTPTPNMSQYL